MATGKGKSSTGVRKKSGKTTSGRKYTRKEQEKQVDFTKEILLWIILAVSILLFISNFGFGGKVGNTVSSFFFGIFGLVAYIFPIILLVGTFFAISNRGNQIAMVKIIATVILVCFLCLFIQLALNGADVMKAFDAYKYSAANKSGGGLLGGLLALALCPNFGLIGSYVINIIVIIICFVLITERSALKGMQKHGRKVYETAKESNEKHREMAEIRREEQELRRMDRKVEGVAIDTRVIPNKKKIHSDEISEMKPDDSIVLPEVSEEKHVSLTAASKQANEMNQVELPFEISGYREADASNTADTSEDFPYHESPTAPSAFSEEAMFAQTKNIQNTEVTSGAAEKVHRTMKQSEEERKQEVAEIVSEINQETEQVRKYVYPSTSLLKKPENKAGDSKQHLQETANKLQQTLKNFGVNVTITNVSCGPAVTRYEMQPEMGVKVSKIVNLADDIKLNLAAADIRIEAPIPGKAAVGIEVPNKENVMVSFRELVESEEFKKHPSKISFCVGKDIGGKVTVADIAKMPHLLIAGATGSGKSVCINTIIMSILYKADPKDVKLIMIDPKVVELSVYNGIPHLMIPVVTDPKKASGALNWAVAEMVDRYNKFAETNVRDLKGYNAKIDALPDIEGQAKPEKMSQIVIIVDELADLMMVAPGDVESSICRLAQLARAAGIHLILATQRPSVNVITGLIKANMPSRIAFSVTSGIDSRTILDMNGAEKLLGKGDMLFDPQGVPKPIRVQGAFVSDKEVFDVVNFLKEQNGNAAYSSDIEEKMNSIDSSGGTVEIDGRGDSSDGRDPYFGDAAKLLIDKEKGSIGMLQRYFKVGFNRAARIMDQLEEAGIVGPEEGTKPRKVLMSLEEFEQYEEEYL